MNIEVLSKLFENFSVQTPEDKITNPVKVQIINVSIKGSKIETNPSSIECFVFEVACAIGADPCPASFEYKPLATPYVKAREKEAPRNPPTTEVPSNTSRMITSKEGMIFSKLKINTLNPPTKYISAIKGTIEAAIVEILFIPPMITNATNMLITTEVNNGLIPKLDSIVLEILSI
tara:strand:- start:29 stop:556 length:528 start_codon:yes stop_codon:yes gene_type:complete